ncbi:MT-A70 family protein [Agrobacterium genomosp. 5 str. CFBP 6626]|nr:MT-A70 family protein [Agrobacterium genomosp. 5 str. CFBP 6626]
MLVVSNTSEPAKLSALVSQAANALASAVSAAEILEARDKAGLAYSAAKHAARFAKVKNAHDEVVSRAYRVQADALEIESLAKRRLADEYDAAQERGEVQKHGGQGKRDISNRNIPRVVDLGISAKEIFDARQIRDAIENDPGVVRRVLDDLLDGGDEPTKARLRKELSGPISKVRQAAQADKKQRREQREITLASNIMALPQKRYGVILADPEWRFEPYSRESGMDRSPDNHYPTTTTDDICAREVGSIAAKDCVLFLWATAPMLPDALRVMEAWGFKYKSHAVWAKQRPGDGRGTGYWFLGEHELILVGSKGDVPAPAMGTQWRSVISAPVGSHSEKPELSLEMIESYFPNIPKIELNRRGEARPGWDAWGLEALP